MDLLFGGIGKSIPFNCMARQCWLIRPMNIGFVSYNHANFYRFGEHLVIGQLNEYQCFSAFHWSTSDTSGITVYKCTVTNIENTVRALHSCNCWFNS